jgi:putative peptidoglycan lipid II flippase
LGLLYYKERNIYNTHVIRRLLKNTTTSITRAALILGAASFLSRIIGLLRDRIFAHVFGADTILDAYFAAFRIPDLVYNLLIVGALSAGFIPVFIRTKEQQTEQAWRVTNAVMTLLGVALIVLCTILIICTPALMRIIVPGFSGDTFDLTVQLTRIMFLSPILLGLSSIVSGVLQSLKCFLIYALTPIFYNIGIIIGALIFVPLVGPIGLAYGVVMGACFHLLIQLPTLWGQGYRPALIWDTRMAEVREIGTLMIPRTLGLAASQINLVIITMIASTFAVGSLTVFNFANNLQYFPIGIIGYSFAIAAFPTLSSLFARHAIDDMKMHIITTVRQILFLILPITIIFLLLRAQIVRVVYGTGAFDWSDTILTGDMLAFFSLSLFAQAIIPLLVRAFFARRDTWTPFIIAVVGSLCNIIFSLTIPDFFPESQKILGLAIAFSLAQIIQLSILWITLRTHIGSLEEQTLFPFMIKISIALIPMAIIIQLLKVPLAALVDMTRFWGIFTQGFIAGSIGILIYILIMSLLRVEEVTILMRAMKRKFGGKTVLPAEIREGDEL